ncbi:MAG TPA: hypothetical protein PLH07_06865 [Sulfurovum sp.]|jgi:PBP1b-binding outer membrane lipoprotein LpoB|nr:MAG: hypothetical protein B7Y63_04180 [Sulfurovum sp. 35-42-20]OYY57233.1 MAG: hypothetical protein B7Y52_01835 [Sulfurovum sp. 28-43-6]OYZ25380.1 MAG: hypothetical protein B7Y23_05575 [Sulfurovum sp. 16-42-52]OYZ49848.1 MAG: hypothetical protein B7Y13_03030 [Sulfurovum sp. 24-42-9]OZA45476.1 MAG: hypothetical protein B7X80_04885 [Sulfurovum sp. 17-42-90]OZA59407.1 MAG: hypothetical protein B7X69_08135 [Sulfurovum sp. 39-42-12]HQR74053.1 hypothetical protein [Sulfurovum sp.]
MRAKVSAVASIILLAAFGFSGCTSSMNVAPEKTQHTRNTQAEKPVSQRIVEPSPEKKEAYENTMRKVASGIKDDPNYKRIALDTPEKRAWFRSITYQLWDRQISKQEFMSQGLSKYPNHRYEFQFVINGFDAN